eukprot:TRINITY_DN9277_c0_g1_i1.p1 TRINITY_DN9277_c0_g1~~TRINITY_DN9277_c0_g1_i1.p1  ORF type:complete len:503 (+),score=92.44 TRINITY_DN9277_c0_g1_i1:119-1510(+)
MKPIVIIGALVALAMLSSVGTADVHVKHRAADLDSQETLEATTGTEAVTGDSLLSTSWGWIDSVTSRFTKRVHNIASQAATALETWACAARFSGDLTSQAHVTFVGAGKCRSKNGRPCVLIGVASASAMGRVSIPRALAEGNHCTHELRVIPRPSRGVPTIHSRTTTTADILITEGSDSPVPIVKVGGPMYSRFNEGWAGGTVGAFLKDSRSGDVYAMTNAHVVIDPQCVLVDNEKYCLGRCKWQESIEMCHSRSPIGSVYFGEVPQGSAPKHSIGDIAFARYDDYVDLALVKLSREMAAKVKTSFENIPGKKSGGLHHLIGKNYYTKREQDAVGWKFWKRAFWKDHRRSWDDLIESSVEGKLSVFKDGQTTDVTRGTVSGYGDLATSKYRKQRSYREQLMIDVRNFADHGDSGSGVYDANNNQIIGLLWGGSKSQTFVTPINHVMDDIREWQESKGLDLTLM